MNKMREEFERWARSKSLPVRRCGTGERDYTIYQVDLIWQAWKASRENIEVELPLERLNPVYDMGFNEGRQACLEKLTEQGFKVK